MKGVVHQVSNLDSGLNQVILNLSQWREELFIPTTHIHAVADLGYSVLDAAMVETVSHILERIE